MRKLRKIDLNALNQYIPNIDFENANDIKEFENTLQSALSKFTKEITTKSSYSAMVDGKAYTFLEHKRQKYILKLKHTSRQLN